MKQNGFVSAYFLIGILVILAIVGGVYYLGKSQSVKPVIPRPQILVSPTTQPTTTNFTNGLMPTTVSVVDFPPLYPGIQWEATAPAKLITSISTWIEDGKIVGQEQRSFFAPSTYKLATIPQVTDISYINNRGERVKEQLKTQDIKELDAHMNEVIIPNSSRTQEFLSYYEQRLTEKGWKPYSSAATSGASGEGQGYEKNGHYFSIGWSILYKDSSRQHPTGTRLNVWYE